VINESTNAQNFFGSVSRHLRQHGHSNRHPAAVIGKASIGNGEAQKKRL
jgi:hypothetical protein